MIIQPVSIPLATYRLQLSDRMRFVDARDLVDYLDLLGISDAYPSPLFKAREHSSHGYDVVNPQATHPEFGTEDDFRQFAETLRDHSMGLMLDVVPNHMGIDDPQNVWWQDVLENGISSPYAKYFDIDWDPPKAALKKKVLLPFLGDQYGKVLENQELKLGYDGQRLEISYYHRRFPVAPRTWPFVLDPALEQVSVSLDAEHPERMELESIVTALRNLPDETGDDPERMQHRQREQGVIKRRLSTLLEQSASIRMALDAVINEFNGRPGDARSFDRLEALLAEQTYRLCHWRVATDEINYRRFFDINELAAVRVEDPEVFQSVHALTLRYLERGWVTKLRIDHPDGLLDPQQYFINLQDSFRRVTKLNAPKSGGRDLYLAVEKILGHDEPLPPTWPVCGTTGYDFLNLLNGLFVDRSGVYALREVYGRFTGEVAPFPTILYESKKTILNVAMSSELHVLARQLDRISEQHRWSRDFTFASLRRALQEVIACFPVYRTYIRPDTKQVGEEDQRRIVTATRAAQRRNPALSPSFFEFIRSVLLLEEVDGLTDAQRAERRQFVLKFQQVTGPMMAKGLEDTSFYRYYPLASLNEVGGDPTIPGTTVDQFHHRNLDRQTNWPYSMSATATHDTKRGEDTRARLNVLAEIPELWEHAIWRWHDFNAGLRRDVDGEAVPDTNEEYLLYQMIVGTWPLEPLSDAARRTYIERIQQYMNKALKEAKLHTSWLSPYEEYDRAVEDFVAAILQPAQSEFLSDLDQLVRSIASQGFLNSLAQTLVKICAPGIPDFYQGTELWDFSLVDPDNRRPVDFATRRKLLGELQALATDDLPALAAELNATSGDPRAKLLLTWRALTYRRSNAELFLRGEYIPLQTAGPRAHQVCAFARMKGPQWLLIVVPRLTCAAWQDTDGSLVTVAGNVESSATGETESSEPGKAAVDWSEAVARMQTLPTSWWKDTVVHLDAGAPSQWRHVLSGASMSTQETAGQERGLQLEHVFDTFPVALLEGQPGP